MFYSPEHRCLIYPKDARLVTIEGVQEINGHFVAIPNRLANLQTLRAIGFQVVPPLEINNYHWPIRKPWQPLPHMQTTANFLVLNPRSFCFNDMGTMKTLSSLWAADFLMLEAEKKNERFRALIIAPLSVLKTVWGKHIFDHFAGRRTYAILHGSHDKRRRELEKNVDFYIINPDGLTCGIPSDPRRPIEGLALDLSIRDDIKLALVDEAGCYRSANIRRHRAARTLIGQRPYLWLLTGTPTPNGPLDAYGLARLAGTHRGESFKSFQNRVTLSVGPWKRIPLPSAPEAVSRLLSPSIRFPSTIVGTSFQLPPEDREVPFSKEQEHAWKKLKKEAVLSLQSGALIHAVNEAALRIKLIQVAAGCVYDANHISHDLRAIPRLAEVEQIVEETDRKIVIFAPLTNVLNLLYEHLCLGGAANRKPVNSLDRLGETEPARVAKPPKYEGVILNGACTPREREAILRRFGDNRDKLRICLADPACTSHGINEFITAGTCIWYAPTDKNELYRQGIKRLDRPGQSGPVKIIRLTSTKLERDIYARLDHNETLQGLVLKFAEEQ